MIRTRDFLLQGIVLLVVLSGCGSGENAEESGNGDKAESDAGADVRGDAGLLKSNVVSTVVEASVAVEAPPDALGTLDAGPDALGTFDARPTDQSAPGVDVGVDVVPTPTDARAETLPSDAAGDCGDRCGTIGIGINGCPEIGAYSISPFTVAVGNPVTLTSTADNVNGATLEFHWTATQGSFVDSNAANTSYTCSTSGTATLTLTLTVPGSDCSDTIDQDVHCQ